MKNSKTVIVRIVIVLLVLSLVVGISSAYSDNETYFTCYNCSDCTNALNNNTYSEVRLGVDITNHNGNCIDNPTNFQNKIFDGQCHTIDGIGSGYPIYSVNKNNITIQNSIFTDFGISRFENNDNVRLINNTFNSNIYCCGSIEDMLIDGNTFNGAKIKFWSDFCDGNPTQNISIVNNTFRNLNSGRSLEFDRGYHENLTISDNNFTNVYGALNIKKCTLATISGNTFDDMTSIWGIYLSDNDNNNITISQNTITNSAYSIYVIGGDFLVLQNNNITNDSGYSVSFGSTNNTLITNNTFHLNRISIMTNGGNEKLIISGNNFTNISVGHGSCVYMQSESNAKITNNVFSNSSAFNSRMIFLFSSNSTLIDNNTVNSPYWIGFDITEDCLNTTITNNTMDTHIHGGLYICGDRGIVQYNTVSNLDFCTGPPSGSNYLVRDNNLGNIELKGGINNTIIYNNITGHCWGWAGVYCNNDVYGNNISYNSFTGSGAIEVQGTWRFYDNIISHNTFNTTNDYALFLNNSDNNTIESNNVSSSAGYAFNFTANTTDNKGCGNIGSIVDNGNNYVYNITQGCSPCPPINLGYSVGNFWVNYTWGVETCSPLSEIDSFNVSWSNNIANGWGNTTNSYFNHTTSAHGYLDVDIWAYNSTENRISEFSISDNNTISNNNPIITNTFNWRGDENKLVYLNFDYTDLDGDICTFSTNATKGTLDTTTGIFEWYPDIGIYYWDFTVNDGYGGDDSYKASIIIGSSIITISWLANSFITPIFGMFLILIVAIFAGIIIIAIQKNMNTELLIPLAISIAIIVVIFFVIIYIGEIFSELLQ